MNPKDAITAHVNWKLRLNSLLSGKPSEKLDPSTIQRDNVCELGKWLHLSGAQTIPKEQLKELLAAHAEFHREAARIVREFYAGHKVGTEVVGPGSTLGTLSTRVSVALMKLDPTKTGGSLRAVQNTLVGGDRRDGRGDR